MMQTIKTVTPKRSKHIWYYRAKKDDYKCVMCGAVDRNPMELEAFDRLPEKYERLTDKERALAPFMGVRV